MARARLSSVQDLPAGFVYQPDFISPDEERELLSRFESLNFEPFQYMQFTARRRIVVYGWDYDFSSRKTSTTDPIPEFLVPLRERTAALMGVAPDALAEALVAEYSPGTPIGWHRDTPNFDLVAGISLAGACRMRFRPYKAEGKAVSTILEPRSAYILRGDARWKRQHSIPAVEKLRYSVTFRTLRARKPE